MTSTVERMSDVDALIWAAERDPRLRSTIVAVAVFDGPLDRRRLHHRLERASRVVDRLRQRVAADPLGIAPPRWEVDPDFRLAHHLRLTSLGGRGTRRDLYDLAAAAATLPFDRSRPLWEITLVEGLNDGGNALVLKTHHAVSDGVGGVELSLEVFDLAPEPDPARDRLPPPPDADPRDRGLDAAVRHEARAGVAAARRALDTALAGGADPRGAAHRLGRMLGSAFRQLTPVDGPLSSTMAGRSLDVGLDAFAVPLDDLRTAGRRVDGTINDAFVAAVVLGLTAYHGRHGDPGPTLRLAIPVNRRPAAGDDAPGPAGNHWAPGRLESPLDDAGPDEVMTRVRDRMRRLRHEPAHALLPPLAGVLRRAPTAVTTSVLAAVTTGIDIAASNVPGSPLPLYLQGRAVTELVGFGPLSGAATNVTLLSHADTAHIGVNRDPAAVPDGEALVDDLRRGFEAVLS